VPEKDVWQRGEAGQIGGGRWRESNGFIQRRNEMNDASRDEFEKHVDDCIVSEVGLAQAIMQDGFGDYETPWVQSKWQAWQASRKQALAEYEANLQAELDHAAINDHRMTPPFGRVQGEPGVRAGSIEAVIEFMKGKV
jgi:hypothetical protein